MRTSENRNQRLVEILELLKMQDTLAVRDLASTLNVSEMTIRRDLDTLKKNHVLERGHGYASLIHGGEEYTIDGEHYDLRMARIQNINEKNKIAKFAASMIEPDDWIFLDNGTTVSRITAYLPTDFEFTVLCYNFAILTELLKHPNIKVIFPGGYYYPEDQMFASGESVDFIRRHRANKSFISASGIHETLGITCINAHSVDSKRAIIDSSAYNVLLTDASKFGKVKANCFTTLDKIDMVVTDTALSLEWQSYFRQSGKELKLV